MKMLSFRPRTLLAASSLLAAALGCGTPGGPGAMGPGQAGSPRDSGQPGPAPATCASVCAHLKAAACGVFNAQCEQACKTEIVDVVPARCGPQLQDFFACAAGAKVTCAADGPELQGCAASATALDACVGGGGTPDRCLPDESVPGDTSRQECGGTARTPRLRDCPGGKPDPACIDAPSGGANLFCCP